MDKRQLWERYRRYLCSIPALGLRVDVSRMLFDDDLFERLAAPMEQALTAMDALERGAIANPDEQRMVGHYWLRDPQRAPRPEIADEIHTTLSRIKQFAADVHAGTLHPERADGFYVLLVIGIGGSALGPEFVADALGTSDDSLLVRFIDNTDPDGIDRVLTELEEELPHTLTIVISKSGTTPETRNGMLEVAAAYERAGLSFARHAVAITSAGSKLDQLARAQGWLGIFPMWDWVGGRTSELSAVGLLPAALQGIDIDALLAGARECDAATRPHDLRANPAALLAALWHHAGGGRGNRNLVVLPYADRLVLFSRYLQQLIMESLGKQFDRRGNTVYQGLTVYGNKGSTDQHAFIQQLREGRNDFFVTFIEVLHQRASSSIMIDEAVTSGDYLHGFLHGTRAALFDNDRPSLTITIPRVDARRVGALIALFERTVGLYAELIGINAYHQPGVEAGKKAAGAILDLQRRVLAHLGGRRGEALTAEQAAAALNTDDVEAVFHLLEHLAANPDHGITRTEAHPLPDARFRAH
ncbi:MAG TPA: glucose-6-phosphate isomerase [Phycisphaerae bacterium]|nr:glucose-6-phosphate isomerase [Phycisphaerae bacterium]HNU46558.1 glucose-6-phosphate isomerase [Phycisphaerae bacterium]